MDTINIRFEFTRELTRDDILEYESLNCIEKLSIDNKNHKICRIGFSVPKCFDRTNAYLVNSSEFNRFKHYIMNKFMPIAAYTEVYRVDTPFTYWMKSGEKFNDYSHIFYILSQIYESLRTNSNSKNFEDTQTMAKETFYMGDSTNLNKSNTKIQIYNQAKKLYDSDTTENKILFNKVDASFKDFKQRIRIEVSRKTNISLEELDYSDQYSKAYRYLERNMFNEEGLEVCLDNLYNYYIGAYHVHKMYSPDVILLTENVFEYDVYRKFLKTFTSNDKTLEGRITSARKFLDKFGKSHLYNLRLKKVIPDMKKEFKRQITW